MGYTNSTPNLHLPQWVGSDKPQFLTDMNNAYRMIDSAITNNSTRMGTIEEQWEQQNTDFQGLETSVDNINLGLTQAQQRAEQAVGVANNAMNFAKGLTDCYECSITALKDKTVTPFYENVSANVHLHMYPNLKMFSLEYVLTGQELTNSDLTTISWSGMPWMSPTKNINLFPFLILPIKATGINPIVNEIGIINFGASGSEPMLSTFGIWPYNGKIAICQMSTNSTTRFANTRIGCSNTFFTYAGHFRDVEMLDWTKVN